jgi:hypothetical protein
MEIRDAEVIADDLRVSRALDVGELIDGGVLAIGDTLVGSHLEQMVEAEVTEDRQLRVGDDVYDTLDDAARSVGASNLAGAEFWQKNVDGETVSLNVRMLDDEAVA